MGALLMVVGAAFVAVSFPAPGLTGLALSLSGLALIWIGFDRTRRGGA